MENAAVYFYPRPPRGGRHSSETIRCSRRYFYPRPPRGGRRQRCGQIHRKLRFLSTPSARRATFKRDYSLLTTIFLSTPSARRATTTMWTNSSQASISIHALREEGDYNPFVHTCFFGYFYPRPPRGGRLVEFCQLHQPVVFLSTPSARRATRNSYMFTRFLRDFYPRPPRGGRPEGVTREYFVHIISIHALREEGDMRTVYRVQTAQTFLSTPSARRATRHLFQALHCTR